MAKTPDPIITSDNEIIAKDRRTVMSEISLLKISIRDFPRAKLQKFKVAMAKVLVLIPPPVDAGEAPTHINKKRSISVEKFNAAVSTVLKPAVLGVAAPNMAVITFPNPLCSANVLSYSKKKKTAEPNTNRAKLVMSVILELKLTTQGLTTVSFDSFSKNGINRFVTK